MNKEKEYDAMVTVSIIFRAVAKKISGIDLTLFYDEMCRDNKMPNKMDGSEIDVESFLAGMVYSQQRLAGEVLTVGNNIRLSDPKAIFPDGLIDRVKSFLKGL